MIIVSNTSPILNLAGINKLDILKKLYNQIFIPEAVFTELTVYDDSVSMLVKNSDWIITKNISNQILADSLALETDKGEAEAITLSIELKSTYLLIDETLGRFVASKLNIKHIGLLGILMSAKNKNIVTLIKPIIDDLIVSSGFWINKSLYNHILKTANE